MEKDTGKPYRFKTDVHEAANVVLVELFRDGEPKPLGVRSVPLKPDSTFPERLLDAKAWIAWHAGVTKHEVRE